MIEIMPPSHGAAPPSGAGGRAIFRNLDLIRFVAATVVVIYHLTIFFPDPFIDPTDAASPSYLTHSLAAILFNGPAAVMLFFIVSGICINAPYLGGRPIDLAEFYTRRYIRIGIPLIAACVYSWIVSLVSGVSTLPIWSLWCELAYYLIFPGLIVLIGRFGFLSVFAASVVAVLLLSLFPDAENGHAWHYGPLLSWIVFLPVWLSGVWISENAHLVTRWPNVPRTPALAAIGGLFLMGVAAFTTIAYYHIAGGLKYPLYLMLFFSVFAAVFVFFAVRVDLSAYRLIRFLDRQGAWSYSFYLVHYPLMFLAAWIMVRTGFTGLGPAGLVGSGYAVFAVAIAVSIVFYLAVEKPSHRLAKRLGLKARGRLATDVRRSAVEIGR